MTRLEIALKDIGPTPFPQYAETTAVVRELGARQEIDLDRVIAECDRYFEWVTSEFEPEEYAKLLKVAQDNRASMERFTERLERIREDWLDLH